MSEDVKEMPQVAQVVERYILLRDRKKELKAEYDEQAKKLDDAMERIETHLLKIMQDQGLESIRTPYGTSYVSRRVSATVADWEAVLGFIKSNEEWGMLEQRVSKTAVATWRDEHDDLPPGINWTEERIVNIRRSQ